MDAAYYFSLTSQDLLQLRVMALMDRHAGVVGVGVSPPGGRHWYPRVHIVAAVATGLLPSDVEIVADSEPAAEALAELILAVLRRNGWSAERLRVVQPLAAAA